MNDKDLNLKINIPGKHLELEIDGYTAIIEYRQSGQLLFLIHTEIPPELKGKGAGKTIIEKALQYAQENNFKIVPICPFVQAFLKSHQEWEKLVAPDAEKFLPKLK
jgi:uncharacterized protein